MVVWKNYFIFGGKDDVTCDFCWQDFIVINVLNSAHLEGTGSSDATAKEMGSVKATQKRSPTSRCLYMQQKSTQELWIWDKKMDTNRRLWTGFQNTRGLLQFFCSGKLHG